MITLFWFLFAAALVILVVSLLMSPEANSFSGALVGSSDLELFKEKKEKGTKLILKWTMFTLGGFLLIGSLVIRVLM